MAFCPNCGKQAADDARFCGSCGTAFAPPQQASYQQDAHQYSYSQQDQQQYSYSQQDQQSYQQQGQPADQIRDFFSDSASGDYFDPTDVEKNKAIAGVTYFLFFLPLITSKDSPFAMFHANQSFLLFLVNIAWWIVGRILGLIPILGALISWLGSIALFVFWLLAMIAAFNGKAKRLPLIGNITIFK